MTYIEDMTKQPSIEAELDSLTVHDGTPCTSNNLSILRKALASRRGPVTARAARVAQQTGTVELMEDLVAAFERHRVSGSKTDKGCLAKQALVNALYALDFTDPDDAVYLPGARCVQMEPVWGGPIDTAANLRTDCGFILAQFRHPEALYELTSLAFDAEPVAREGAARALASLGGAESELLLRMKTLAGDSEPRVIAECLSGLMSTAPDRSLVFVTRFLDEQAPEVAEGAALALGQSRRQDAFELLRRSRDASIDADFKTMLLLPIALTRVEKAFEYLCDIVREERQPVAIEAIRALGVCCGSAARRVVLEDAIESRGDVALRQVYETMTSEM